MSRFDRLDKDSYVEVINNTEMTVGYITPDGRKSIWPAPTKKVREVKKRVRLTELYDAMGKPAVTRMLTEGALLIKDSEARDILGLPPLEKYVLDAEQTDVALKEMNISNFEDILKFCSDAILDKIVQRAIDLPLRDYSKIQLLETYSGQKVGDAIRAYEEDNHYDEEAKSATPDGATSETARTPRRKRIVE